MARSPRSLGTNTGRQVGLVVPDLILLVVLAVVVLIVLGACAMIVGAIGGMMNQALQPPRACSACA